MAIQEARRLQRFGVTQAEADTYRQATLRDNFMASMQADYVPAQEILEFLMETLATRSVFSDNNQARLSLGHLAYIRKSVAVRGSRLWHGGASGKH